ncbi:MAG TPA: NAD(P)-dependent oxidoreductase [Caulobacteraceae bacterium]|jgi:3-hydroxyisobutyrate dehydrogenase-like beta-hydroxyacid dehydrogenase|nr:NAD(P)-dependent oxidoreductase [Caulobacteraceae bacterium]
MNDLVGLVGVGIMGSAMGRQLLGNGRRLLAYDRDETSVARIVAAGATAATVGEMAAQCGVIVSSLPSVGALEATVESLVKAGAPGAVLVDTSTLPIEAKRAAYGRLQEAGIAMLDAPVSGTGAQAASGDLSVLASGDREMFDRARPIIESFARSVHYLGDFGAGMAMKLLANHLVAVHSLAAAEVLSLAVHAGIAPSLAVSVLNDGAGASRMLAVRGPVMATQAFDPPTAHIDTLIKDLALIEAFAAGKDVQTPMLRAAVAAYRAAGEAGWGRRDISSMFSYLQEASESA